MLLTVGLSIASIAVLTDEPDQVTFETASGDNIFRTKGCVGCHTAHNQVSQTNVGPNLSDLADRAEDRVDELSADEYVRQSILAPQAYIVEGFESTVAMPALRLNGDEVDALVVFLLEG